MSSKRNVALSGLVAAIIAIGLIAAAIYIPGMGISKNPGTNITTTTTGEGSGSSGTLSVLMTDPPTVPTGTTDVYMTFDEVGVHIAGQGNSSQYWNVISESGTIDLMQTVNVSQTLANTNLPAGRTYNAIGFNVTNVVVTYNGVNYTSDLVYGQSRLFIVIPGGVSISASQNEAVLVDMTPKILLLGSPSNPSFAFLPSARAFVIPTSEIPAEAHTIGARHNLQSDSWWAHDVQMSQFELTGVALSPTSLQINVTNDGSSSLVFRLAAITSGVSVSGGWVPPLQTSAVFLVEPNTSLVLVNSTSKSQFYAGLAASGYLLPPGASVTFTYSGTALATGLFQLANQPTQAITSGTHYIVRLYANDKVAAAATTAT